jgi:dimethylhistidine N-methyltransferase
MKVHSPRLISLQDEKVTTGQMRREVLAGLSQSQKVLPSKLFYDERGSLLFNRICELDEYYLTRTETQILQDHVEEISGLVGPYALLIEYGSGNSLKTRVLLDHLNCPAVYLPVDISMEHLQRSADRLATEYPSLRILPICADYTKHFQIPLYSFSGRRIVFFSGSTIGNFCPNEAQDFLRRAVILCGRAGGLLIGVDLKKDSATLERAYNDSLGITAAFNLNLLERLNRELGANFEIPWFQHTAFYNSKKGRIEMHLTSLRSQAVRIGDVLISFKPGESILTEVSYKYSVPEFVELASMGGCSVSGLWTDESKLFSVYYLTRKPAFGEISSRN